jgi:hypothetical protein
VPDDSALAGSTLARSRPSWARTTCRRGRDRARRDAPAGAAPLRAHRGRRRARGRGRRRGDQGPARAPATSTLEEEKRDSPRRPRRTTRSCSSEVIVPPARASSGARHLAAAAHRLRRQPAGDRAPRRPVKRRLSDVEFQAGDVLLLQGPSERVADAIGEFGLLPLAERDVASSSRGACCSATGTSRRDRGGGDRPAAGARGVRRRGRRADAVRRAAARRALRAIDWPVIVLLGAMIPVGTALEATGGTALIADGVWRPSGGLGPVWVLVT